MKIFSLDGKWRGEGISPEHKRLAFTGEVPGCVHTDLWREGKIPDPYYRYNGDECQWIENWSWYYERDFEVSEICKDAYLLFEGLDVYCDVFLNGTKLGSTENMFISHRFEVGDRLKIGKNTLRCVFYSPVMQTLGRPARNGAFTTERLYTRRIQCTYYWDWVNRFVTCGIYRPVKLVYPEKADIESIYTYTKSADEYSAQIGIEINFELYGKGAYAFYTIKSPDGKVIYSKKRLIVESSICETVDIRDPLLWYPNGYGKQPLYTLEVKIYEDETLSRLICGKTSKIGIRTIKILQLPDLEGSESYQKCLELKKAPHVSGSMSKWDKNEDFSGFIVIVNGIRIMCKGANWVPCEPFPSAETEEKMCELLTLSTEAHMNMVRVWGGGIFEKDYFYDKCDELGILVTQDFLMACGNYPEDDEWFLDNLKKEAAYAAKKLRSHACLAWWSGDNENAMAANENMQDYTGRKSALVSIGPVLKVLDPYRYFLPSSPYGGVPYGSITKGTTHNTNYIGHWFSYIRYNDFYDYREFFDKFLCRFCAEEPVMGAPSVSSLRKFMTDEDIFGNDDAIWRYHTKNNPAEIFREFEIFDYLKAISEKLFGKYQSGIDKVFKMQYTQYEWIRISMELFRRNKWFSSGLIYWMLNDCWPASGWAIIDYYALPKAAYYAFKRSSKDVICAVSKENALYKIHVCNDSLKPASGNVRLSVIDLKNGTFFYETTTDFQVAENSSEGVLEIPSLEVDKYISSDSLILCDMICDGVSDRTFFFEKRPQDVNFPNASVTVINRTENSITVKADQYVHSVSLDGEFVFSDNYFSLLPNEEKTVTFRKSFIHSSDNIEISWLGKIQ